MHRFELEVRREVGALERVLGVARRRRLGLESLSVVAMNAATWNVSITGGITSVEAALAIRQFQALENVNSAALAQPSNGNSQPIK